MNAFCPISFCFVFKNSEDLYAEVVNRGTFHVPTRCLACIVLLTPTFTQDPTGLATNSLVKSDFSNSPYVL